MNSEADPHIDVVTPIPQESSPGQSQAPSSLPLGLVQAPIHAIQPGGGTVMSLELFWGVVRRRFLRIFFPTYVSRMRGLRDGTCPDCPGKVRGCRQDIVDPRDLKYFRNVCGFQFYAENDRFRHRENLGFARPGLAELLCFSLALAGLILLVASAWWHGLYHWIAVPLLLGLTLCWAEVVWFFRDPQRRITTDPSALVSPADGTITDVGVVEVADFPEGKALRIGIFLSIFNVHVNRAPRTATVTQLRYFPGQFKNALRMSCAEHNEQLWIDLRDVATQLPMRVKQIAGAIARRIVCQLRLGETVQVGSRIGMIKFGSRTELYLPALAGVDIKVKVGQKVCGGSTVLLHFTQNDEALRSNQK